MNEATLENVCRELSDALIGRRFGKIFPLSRLQMAVDFRLPESRYLFISVEPGAPRMYLIRRRIKDLERSSGNPSLFVLASRKRLSGAELISVEKIPDERVVRLGFSGENELGSAESHDLVVQLTGRSANLFLLDQNGFILDRLRETRGDGQEIGTRYAPPFRERETGRRGEGEKGRKGDGETVEYVDRPDLSEALDRFYLEKEAEQHFKSRADAARKKLNREIAKNEKLRSKLRSDLENHGDAGRWKRFGDLILANLATAKRSGNKIIVTDFFDADLAKAEIEADENDSLTEAAERYFKRYTKARNAAAEVSKRLKSLGLEHERLHLRRKELEAAIAEGNDSLINEEKETHGKTGQARAGRKKVDDFNGARRFVSSDGFEILVGKKAKDNDQLTFRVAKSLDTWLHAADYPGSHVIIRNPNRKEIPQRTLLEAAQLAAFYSSGKSQPKAAIHYTQKKFVNKPRGAAPGLVSLASFKTILVEPKVPELG